MRKYSIDVHRVHHSVRLVVTLFVLLGFLIQNVAGSAYYSLLMEPYTTVTSPPVILEAGTAGTSTFYTNNTSAKVSVVAPAPTPTYYPSGYSVLTGSYFSGSVPSSVQTVDTEYFIVKSSGLYSPSGYNLLGSNKLASGTVPNLALNDGSYMTFRSYASAFSSTSNTTAIIAYRSNTGTNLLSSPKSRTWNGSAWSSSESEMATAGSAVRFVRIAYSSVAARYYENVVVTLSDDGYLDAYVWNGSSWDVSNDIASVGTTANAYRPFDIEYEKTSSEALLVYFSNSAAEIGYKIWNGTAWSQEYTYDLVSAASVEVRWLSLAQNPTGNSNEIALVCIDATNSDAYALIWDGSSWGDKYLLASSVTTTTREDVAVAYEQTSGYAHFAYGTGNDAHVVRRTGVANYTDYTVDLTSSRPPYWFSLKDDPASNRLMLLAIDNQAKLVTADWNSTTWTLHAIQDQSLDTSSRRCADIAWEPTGSKVLMVWGGKSNELSYNTWTPGSGWGTESTITMAGTHPWIQLRRDPRGVGPKILGATLDSNNDLGSLKWDGTTLAGTAAAFTSDTTTTTYECFEIAFQRFGDPTEFTSEVEFTGSSNTYTWTQLNVTVDSSWTLDSVDVTVQIYNSSAGQYPSAGEGYSAYTSGTALTDETEILMITTNPQDFRNATGNWKIKVKGTKTTDTQFDFKADWIEFKPTYSGERTVSTEFIFSGMTENPPTQLNFTVVTQYDTSSVSVTIQVWNYSSSTYVTSGEGYSTYTSSGSNETTELSINTNPQFYASDGNAKIKVTGVLTTSSTYQQETNQVKLVYKYDASSTYDYVLSVTEQDAVDWKVNLTVYGSSNVTRLSGTTISFYDGTTSDQIVVSGGIITQSEGPVYDLYSSATIKIKMTNVDATSSGTSYLYVYLRILVPDTSTYALYIITFEIT